MLHKLLESYEQEWQRDGYNMSIEHMCSFMFLLVSCLGGKRGFKVMWTDLAALRYDLLYCKDRGDFSAIFWPVVGRFKAHDGQLGCYLIPIAGTTNSDITFFEWTQRFVCPLAMDEKCDGWAFKNGDDTHAKAAHYMEDIYQQLETIQVETSLIDRDCNIRAEYGAQQSGRRFLTTTEAIIKEVKPYVVEYQCR